MIAVAGVATAQKNPDLASKADAYIKAAGIQGSVLLAKSGKVILAKGYGLADVDLDVPNTPATIFRLGSITKQFTAAAILQLQERGRLKVGDLISKYIPGTPAAWNGVTIHHLLRHTSGIPSCTDGAGYKAHMREQSGAPLDFINRFRDLPLEFTPGEKFHYDNSGYFLLGVIIEQVSSMRYEDYLRRNIFEPLQMTATGYDWPATILKGRASGYSKAKEARFNTGKPEYLASVADLIPAGGRQNLQQLLHFFPQLEDGIKKHDDAELRLAEGCRVYMNAIVESPDFNSAFEEVASETPDFSRFFGAYSDPMDRKRILAEYLVNNLLTVELPSYYSTAPVWNRHQARFRQAIFSVAALDQLYQENRNLGGEMLRAVEELITRFETIRFDLSLELDVPIVAELSGVR